MSGKKKCEKVDSDSPEETEGIVAWEVTDHVDAELVVAMERVEEEGLYWTPE